MLNMTFQTTANLNESDLIEVASHVEDEFKDILCHIVWSGGEPQVEGKEWQKAFYQLVDWMKENYTFTKY